MSEIEDKTYGDKFFAAADRRAKWIIAMIDKHPEHRFGIISVGLREFHRKELRKLSTRKEAGGNKNVK